jgi:hypothetical protein
MRKDLKTNHYRFNLAEEKWIIDSVIMTEMTRPITDSERVSILKIKEVMLDDGIDPLAFVWEPVYQIFQKYQIGGCPKSIYTTTHDMHYVGPGNGKYYKLFRPDSKGVVDFEGKKKKRQDKRNAVCEQAANKYKDIPMGGDDMLAKLIRDNHEMKTITFEMNARMEAIEQETKQKIADLNQVIEELKHKTTEPDIEPYTEPKLRIVNGGVSSKLQALRGHLKNRVSNDL